MDKQNESAGERVAPTDGPAVGSASSQSHTAASSLVAAAATKDEDAPLRPSTPSERRRAFQLLYVALMFLGMGQTMMFAVLPQIARNQLGFSELATGAVITLSGILWFLASPYWGRMSDTWGRKPVILIGLIGYAISTASFGVVMDLGIMGLLPLPLVYGLMVFTRGIFGVLGPGAQTGSQAYIVDRTTRAKRTETIATLGSAHGVGSFVGPGLMSSLVVFGLVMPFYIMGGLVFISALVILWFLPERTPPSSDAAGPKVKMLDGWKDKRIFPFLIYGFVLAVGQGIPMQSIGFYMEDVLHLEEAEAIQMVGVAIMASAMSALFAQLVIVQRFKFSAATLMSLGGAASLASFMILAFAQTYGLLVTAMVMGGMGFGLARPGMTAASSLAVSREEQGWVAGIVGSTGALGFVLTPFISMPLYQWIPQAPYVLGMCLMAALLVASRFVNAFRKEYVVTGDDDPESGLRPL